MRAGLLLRAAGHARARSAGFATASAAMPSSGAAGSWGRGSTHGSAAIAAAVAAGGALVSSRSGGRHVRCAATASATPVAKGEPQLRFGAIADVQYADVDDQWNFRGTQMRAYRRALECLRRAVADWNSGPPLAFVANLGDIIDQQCESLGDSHRALELVLREFRGVTAMVHHLVGNHELYNFSRSECAKLIPNITPWYRSWVLSPHWRIVVLDAYELNTIERGGSEAVEEGLDYLSRYNPNDLRAPRGSVDCSTGLRGLESRYLPMGGGYKGEQLRWLRGELEAARRSRERVIVMTHLPIHPGSAAAGALTWNFEEAMGALRSAGPGVVAAVLSGHDHSGGYAFDEEVGTHYVTLPSPLHTSADDPRAHCVVEAYADRLEICGRGLVPSRTLPLLPLPDADAGAPLAQPRTHQDRDKGGAPRARL